MSKIYTVGNGKYRQFARHSDGTWFTREALTNTGGWSKWHVSTDQAPFGLYLARRYSAPASLPDMETQT